MGTNTDKAKALLEIALNTYQDDIRPGLDKDKRYTGAMIANALGIAERRLEHDDPTDALVRDLGADDLAALAKAIRAREIADTTHDGLARHLREYVRAELAITNPGFLKRREG